MSQLCNSIILCSIFVYVMLIINYQLSEVHNKTNRGFINWFTKDSNYKCVFFFQKIVASQLGQSPEFLFTNYNES